jgi:hypothetical protein
MSRVVELLLAPEPESVRALGQGMFRRIAAPNWSVEWNLPHWLGDLLGLTDDQKWALVGINVLGLGYVRIHDDYLDGEAPKGDPSTLRRLETKLFQAAQNELRMLLGDDAWFWDAFDALMGRWYAAELWLDGDSNVLKMKPAERGRLPDFGAPLLISCAACVALKPDTLDLVALTKPVQHYLTAAVLYDHMKDWRDDLAGERKNLFIQALLGNQASSLDRAVVHRGIYRALIIGDDVSDYIDLVLQELMLGAESAHHLGLAPFGNHLTALADEARQSTESKQEGIRTFLTQGQELFLPA